MTEAIEEGKVEVRMDGKKLKGGFALIHTGQQEPRWLLLKMDDEQATSDPNAADAEPDGALADGAKEIAIQER